MIIFKKHPWFDEVDWSRLARLGYDPPLIPPRGEVNAADAFDIGNFDDDETKGIKLSEEDLAHYENFTTIVSSRWQQEVNRECLCMALCFFRSWTRSGMLLIQNAIAKTAC